jgi:adsorption protein B
MSLETLDAVLRTVAYPVAGGIFLSQLDELFVDANYLARGLFRKDRRRIHADVLRNVEQKRIAILVPAWHESEVLDRMVEGNLATIDYDRDRYDLFCGTYPNDPETTRCVEQLARRFPNVHLVEVPNPGPTSKADCLNAIYRGIVAEEQRRGRRFDILLMHDAEDVIHPLSLRLYSHLIPRYEFVQTPVFSLDLSKRHLVAGTYIDEFAEHHLKELRVREELGGLVPSAGVGTAFDRKAFEEVAAASGDQPFDPESLTEDYEIGLKFRLAGRRVHFACAAVEREPGAPHPQPRIAGVNGEEYIATREYFPWRLRASVRQRSRWILGISFQAWAKAGWRGPPALLYSLWRDRKALVNAILLFFAYLLAITVIGRWAYGAASGTALAPLCPPGSLLEALFLGNVAGMIWRGLAKLHFVSKLYGLGHGLVSVPRAVLGNFIAIVATARAAVTWSRHLRTRAPLRWAKTAHTFPELAAGLRRPRLGELLVRRAAITPSELAHALDAQSRCGLPVGELLTVNGFASERAVLEGLAEQLDLRAEALEPAEIPAHVLGRMAERDAEALGVLPLGLSDAGAVVLATARPLSAYGLAQAERLLGAQVQQVLTPETALRRARSVAYRRAQDLAPRRMPLGERLVASGRLTRAQVESALEEASHTGEMLGEYLLRKGAVGAEELSQAFAEEGGGYREVEPDDGDPEAVARLGYGCCALHEVVPLRGRTDAGETVVACARLVHEDHRRTLAATLGGAVFVMAPAVQVRVALAIAAGRGVGSVTAASYAEEIAALARRGLCEHPALLLVEAESHGVSPVDRLLARAEIAPEVAAAVRADALRLPVASDTIGDAARWGGILPPALENRGVVVKDASAGALLLAAAKPTADLAREAAFLLPGWQVGWQVSPALAGVEGRA